MQQTIDRTLANAGPPYRLPRSYGILAAVLLAVGLVPAVGCAGHEQHAVGHADANPVEVQTTMPTANGTWGSLVVPGRVKAREEITLTARISARLTGLPRREGDAFAAGEVLARFDAPETQDALRSAREGLHAAAARARQARTDAGRAQTLYEQRVIAKRDLELAQLELASAEAALADARANLQRWEEGTAVTAPFAGIVARRHVDPGRTLSPGEPLLDLRSSSIGQIEAAIPESALPYLAEASVQYQYADRDWLPARLARVDGMTDYTTRTRLAYFVPEAKSLIEPGSFVRVRLERVNPGTAEAERAAGEEHLALAVPTKALVRRGALTGVYVVREDRARLRWLRVGREADGRIEVLAGLSADEPVVLEPEGVADGQWVRGTP